MKKASVKLLLAVLCVCFAFGTFVASASSDTQEINGYLGDVTGDCLVQIKDATTIQKCVAKLVSFDGVQKTLADLNNNKNVDLKDATLIQRAIAYRIADTNIGYLYGCEKFGYDGKACNGKAEPNGDMPIRCFPFDGYENQNNTIPSDPGVRTDTPNTTYPTCGTLPPSHYHQPGELCGLCGWDGGQFPTVDNGNIEPYTGVCEPVTCQGYNPNGEPETYPANKPDYSTDAPENSNINFTGGCPDCGEYFSVIAIYPAPPAPVKCPYCCYDLVTNPKNYAPNYMPEKGTVSEGAYEPGCSGSGYAGAGGTIGCSGAGSHCR